MEVGLGLDVLDGGGELLGEFGAFDGLGHDDGEGAGGVVLVLDEAFLEGGGDDDAGGEGAGVAAV